MGLTLAVVIPAYNEQECIARVVTDWLNALGAIFPNPDELRLIVVNDGSRDRTGEILDDLALHDARLLPIHQPNGGHGKAVLTGYHKAVELKPEWVFQTDSDDQFIPKDFPKLWEKREESNFILGYRKVRSDAIPRLVITRIVRLMILLLFQCRVQDANVPYRLIRGRYLTSILAVVPEQFFAPNIFFSVLARRDKQNLFEIPISHKERETGTVSIVKWKLIKVCMRSAKELLYFSFTLSRRLRALQTMNT